MWACPSRRASFSRPLLGSRSDNCAQDSSSGYHRKSVFCWLGRIQVLLPQGTKKVPWAFFSFLFRSSWFASGIAWVKIVMATHRQDVKLRWDIFAMVPLDVYTRHLANRSGFVWPIRKKKTSKAGQQGGQECRGGEQGGGGGDVQMRGSNEVTEQADAPAMKFSIFLPRERKI